MKRQNSSYALSRVASKFWENL